MRRCGWWRLLLGWLACCNAFAQAGPAPLAAQQACDAAFSAVDGQMRADIEAGAYPGAVYMLSVAGRSVHHAALGMSQLSPPLPLQEDAIFRLASLSKPITAVAIMMLVDEGKLTLDDPLPRYLPEFARLRLADGTQPAAAITLRQLLTHTSGLLADARDLAAFAEAWRQRSTLAAQMPVYAQWPLASAPGTRFAYSAFMGFDVLARVVEVVSGQSYERFLQTRLFAPLQMRDTGFRLSPAQQARLVPLYRRSRQGLLPSFSEFNSETYFSGAAGLYSTGADYLRFAHMLAGHGQLGSVRILSRAAADQLSQLQLPANFSGLPEGMAWGLGMRIVSADPYLPPGSYGWSGAYGGHFWIDPQHDLVAVLLLNISNAGGAAAPSAQAFEARSMQVLPFCDPVRFSPPAKE